MQIGKSWFYRSEVLPTIEPQPYFRKSGQIQKPFTITPFTKNTITPNLWPAWNSWKKKKTIQVKLFYIATCITYVYWKWVHLALWQTKGNKLKCRGCTYQHKKNTNNEVRNKKKDCLKKLLCQKLKS